MKTKKVSRNRQRKVLYAAKASKASRNEVALDGPVVGHFETVTHATRVVCGDNGEVLGTREVPVKPYQRIVHDDLPEKARRPGR